MFLDNKYTKWYYNIILNAQCRQITNRKEARNKLGYPERHHIIPESLGGSDSIDNLIFLTAREHLICHLLLIRMTTNKNKSKMINALWAMINLENPYQERVKINSRLYESIRREFSKKHSDNLKGRKYSKEHSQKISNALKGKPSKLKGVPRPESVKQKISDSLTGIPKSETHKQNIKKTHKGFSGKIPTEQHRIKISQKKLSIPKIECLHCKKLFDPGNFKKYHGDKCKLKGA